MVYTPTLQLAPARRGLRPGRLLTLLAAAAIALTGVGLAPGNALANETYPTALAVSAPGAPAPAPLPPGSRYLTRREIERIAKDGIGKLQGLRIGPFAPGAASAALPLGLAERVIGHSLPAGASPATPTWLVTVDAPPQPSVLGEPATATVFTDVVDAVSGAILDNCPGCRSVKG
jgi:hypothetical protein